MTNATKTATKNTVETTTYLPNGEEQRTRHVQETVRERVDPERYNRTGDAALREAIYREVRDQRGSEGFALDPDYDRFATWGYDQFADAPWDYWGTDEWHIMSLDPAVAAHEQLDGSPAQELREFVDQIREYEQPGGFTAAAVRHLKRNGYTYAAMIDVYEHSAISLQMRPSNMLDDEEFARFGRTGWDSRSSILIFGTGEPEDAKRAYERFAAYVGGAVFLIGVHSVTVWDVTVTTYDEDPDTEALVDGTYRAATVTTVETEEEDWTTAYGWNELDAALDDAGFSR